MRNSLKEKLKSFIKSRGEVSYGELCQFVVEEGYKVSTAERRLRPSESPEIGHIMKKSKRNTDYIAAYTWGKVEPQKPKVIFEGNKVIMIMPK